MSEQRTLVYRVTMNTDGAKKGGRAMQVTMQAMSGDAKQAEKSLVDIAKTIDGRYNTATKIMVDNTKSAKSEMQRMTREANKNQRAFESLAREYAHMSAMTGKSADEQQILNAQFRLGKNATAQQRAEVRKLVTEYQQLRNAANKTQGSMRGFRGQMSNLGFQLQDVAVQAQMGTNAMVILGQQGSQLAGGFGPTGALIGAGIAFGAMIGNIMLPSLFKAEEKIGDLTEKFKELARTTGISENRARFLIETEKRAIAERSKKIKGLRDEIIQYARYQQTYDEYAESVKKAQKTQEGYDKQIRKTLLTEEQWNKQQKENNFQYLENINRLEEINDLNAESEKNMKLYAMAVGQGTEEQEKWAESNRSIIDSLRDQVIALDKSKSQLLEIERAQELNILRTQGATDSKIAEAEAMYALLIARARANEELEKENKLKAEQAKADAAYAKLQSDLQKQWQKQQADMEKRLTQIDNIKQRLEVGGLARLTAQYEEERKLLAGHNEALQALDAEYAREKMKIQGTPLEQYMINLEDQINNFDDLTISSLENFTQGFGQAFSNAVFESESLGDAMKNLFMGVGKSMVAFFAEWAAQELILFTLRQVLGKSAAAGAGTAIAFEAQAASLQAGINAFSSTAAIPIVGPALAPAAMGTALSITQPMAAAIAGLGAGFAGAYDKGGTIPQDMFGIVSEYGNELVNGVMVKGSQGGSRVVGREETAQMMSGQGGSIFNVYGNDNASPEQIANALVRKMKRGRGGKQLDNALYDAQIRGARNRGRRNVTS